MSVVGDRTGDRQLPRAGSIFELTPSATEFAGCEADPTSAL